MILHMLKGNSHVIGCGEEYEPWNIDLTGNSQAIFTYTKNKFKHIIWTFEIKTPKGVTKRP